MGTQYKREKEPRELPGGKVSPQLTASKEAEFRPTTRETEFSQDLKGAGKQVLSRDSSKPCNTLICRPVKPSHICGVQNFQITHYAVLGS